MEPWIIFLIGTAVQILAMIILASIAWGKFTTKIDASDARLTKLEGDMLVLNERYERDRKLEAERHETLTLRIGETGAALREHVRQIELWMRDNLLSKQTYNLVNEKSDGRLDRIEAKLDRLTEDRSS